ncbi:MAG: 30S ribosomal protein S8 [Planctomycetes bacterium]|nr:30S ribosomal protein S8 [Planctomycetota bacterium]MCW8140005.1 30S ribosomal protein S8 [Planctomycetota bacterium]
MMTDPIADMLTQIRNALQIRRQKVRIPRSALKVQVADVLKREGYIAGYHAQESKPGDGIGAQGWLEIDLKYGPEGEDVISRIDRVSKPGRRVYFKAKDLLRVMNGLGINILSTSQGVLSSREARARGIGGEVLAQVY